MGEEVTLNDRLEAYFKERPLQWIDGKALSEVAGYAGWRNRVTDLRLMRGLDIKNRTQRVKPDIHGHSGYTKSEYIYTPAKPERLF